MRGRRLEKTGSVFAEYVEDFYGPRTRQMIVDRLPQPNGQCRTGSYDQYAEAFIYPCNKSRLATMPTSCLPRTTGRRVTYRS